MIQDPVLNTREHLLATGEQLCLQRGFNGMGLSELLTVARVPKGSFYHYFPSKEAFGVSVLARYYSAYNQFLAQHFADPQFNYREKLLAWYQNDMDEFSHCNCQTHCLTVKLSAEVCDLSAQMHQALNEGSQQIITQLTCALEKGQQDKSLVINNPASHQSQVIYALWLGASLQAKISRHPLPLETAFHELKTMLMEPSCP